MTQLLLLVSLWTSTTFHSDNIADWINDIVDDMIEMNDLGKYSLEPIPENAKLNFFWVEKVQDIAIQDSTFTMLISSNKKEYCNKLTFHFVHHNGTHYLKFAEPRTSKIFNKDVTYIDPWIKSEKLCD